MLIAICGYPEWDLERRTGALGFAGYILDSPFNLTNVLKIRVELEPIARGDAFFENRNLSGHGIEDAAGPLSVDNSLVYASTVAEQALEYHTRIDFGRKRRRRRWPRCRRRAWGR